MIATLIPNSRAVEPRLAPHFHKLLSKYPPTTDEPHTEERAEALVADAVQWKASDIHIEPGTRETRIRLRVDGLLYDVAAVPISSGQYLASYFKTLAGIDATVLAQPEHGHGRLEAGGTLMEMRTTVAPTPDGEMVGMRLRDTRRPLLRLDNLGMSDADQSCLKTWLSEMQGMLLVCGPVGSGKTSTLYSLLHELQTLPRSIITVEDPVESRLDGITQIQVNAKRGLTFPDAIRAMLRLDADYLLVGEIRDPESAHMAITASGTGLTLLSTIHARDAVGAVTALRNNGAKDWEIGATLEMCISQRLVRRLCLHCRKSAAPTEKERQWFSSAGTSAPEQLWQPKGCDACGGTGFDGRIGIFELWRLDGEARRLILHGADGGVLGRHALEQGTLPLFMDAVSKVVAGLVPLSEIRSLGGTGSHPRF